jgi:hypothetical protein
MTDDLEHKFKIGDLVNFIGYSYAPDYYYPDDHHGTTGIIIDKVKALWIPEMWTYRVFWFKTGNTSEVSETHLKGVKPNMQTNYDGTQNQ